MVKLFNAMPYCKWQEVGKTLINLTLAKKQ